MLSHHAQSLPLRQALKDLKKRSYKTDQVLSNAWQLPDRIALIAIGGYGREELFPHSDIDLLILYQDAPPDEQAFIHFLDTVWGQNLKISHSVRSIEDCVKDCHSDDQLYTSLLEARAIQDPAQLLPALTKALTSIYAHHNDFYQLKLKEQTERHIKYAFNLQPNIKNCPGGLRDIHMIRWFGEHYSKETSLRQWIKSGFITHQEYREVRLATAFLSYIRTALHQLTGKEEDRLLFDYQKVLAEQLGYQDDHCLKAVERFMQDFYRATQTISLINEILLQAIQEEIITSAKPKPLTDSPEFQTLGTSLGYSDKSLFYQQPVLAIESFLKLSQHTELTGFTSKMIRLLREIAERIDDGFRNNPKAKSAFLALFHQPQGIYHQVARMFRYGILNAYIPDFQHTMGQMQFDLFHTYTVDMHAIYTLREMRSIVMGELKNELGMCTEVAQRLPNKHILYLAGLFHDIGKGTGQDHSTWGAEAVLRFAEHHNMSATEGELLAWLIQNHLMMSLTAQKTDISDPEVIKRFAKRLIDQSHLDLLYVLTVCDIRSTNITLWNGWRDSLLRSLYTSTTQYFENQAINRDSIISIKDQVLLELKADRIQTMQSMWNHFPDAYFYQNDVNTVAWHAKILTESDMLPIIGARKSPQHGEREVLIYCKRQSYLFATVTHAIDRLNLSILHARSYCLANDFILADFVLMPQHEDTPHTTESFTELQKALQHALQNIRKPGFQQKKYHAKPIKHFDIKTKISIQHDKEQKLLTVHIITIDQPGLLAEIFKSLTHAHVHLNHMNITTMGEKVDDTFVLSTEDPKAFSSAEWISKFKQSLINSIQYSRQNRE